MIASRRILNFATALLIVVQLFGCSRERGGSVPLGKPSSGTDVGNGCDTYSGHSGTAWFAGTDAVTYCLKLSQGFGRTETEALELIRKSHTTWNDYLDEASKSLDLSYLPRRYIHSPVCQGNENITYILGSLSEQQETWLAPYNRPLGFARLLHRDPRSPEKNRGVIQVAPRGGVIVSPPFPNWDRESALLAVLSHELGHTMGLWHITGTIMDDRLDYFIQRCTDAELERIDLFRELVPSLSKKEMLSSLVSNDRLDEPELFLELTGKRLEGEAKVRLVRRPKQEDFDHEIILSDDRKTFPLHGIEGTFSIQSFPLTIGTFKHLMPDGSTKGYRPYSGFDVANEYDQEYLLPTGERRRFLIVYNSGDSSGPDLRTLYNPIELYTYIGGRRTLIASFSLHWDGRKDLPRQ